jgi:hypothetical protein
MLKNWLYLLVTFVDPLHLRLQKTFIVKIKVFENESLLTGMNHPLLQQSLGKLGLIITQLILIKVELIQRWNVRRH